MPYRRLCTAPERKSELLDNAGWRELMARLKDPAKVERMLESHAAKHRKARPAARRTRSASPNCGAIKWRSN